MTHDNQIGADPLSSLCNLFDRFAPSKMPLRWESPIAQHCHTLIQHFSVLLGFLAGVGNIRYHDLVEDGGRNRLHDRNQVHLGLRHCG